MEATKTSEQRKHTRFETPDAIAVITGNICRLVNISRGGLSFKSFLAIDLPAKWSLDIIIPGNNCQLTEFPVKLVWKAAAVQSSPLLITAGNVGVKFDDLYQSQAEELGDFLFQF